MVNIVASSKRRELEIHFEKFDETNKKEFKFAKYLSVAVGAAKYLDLKSRVSTFLEINPIASAFE